MSQKIRPRGETFSAETWHYYCRSRFLGCEDIRLPDGRTHSEPNRTSTLDRGEFSEYMQQVEAFANEHGAYLEDEVFA